MNSRTIQPDEGLNLALEIIGKAHDMGLTNRRPRLLQSYELEFLMNDLAFLGIAPKRMHEMLKFFYKSWADRADMDENWLITGEECQLHRYLKETLEFQGAMIEWEAPGVACALLEANPQLADALDIDEITLVDAHLMSRATQEMCALAARGNVSGTAVDEPSVPTAEDYPCAPVEAIVDKLEIKSAAEKTPEKRFFETPQEEFTFIGRTVAEALASGMDARCALVAVPNGAWATGVAQALREQGIPAAFRTGDAPLHGDITSFEASCAAQAATLLALVADPSDATAWRCWCGFGVHMAHNEFFDALWRFGRERSLDFIESLNELREHGKQELDCSNRAFFDVMNRFEMASSELPVLEKLRGKALIDALCSHVCSNADATEQTEEALAAMLEPADGDSARDLIACLRRAISMRPWSSKGVRVGCLEDVADADTQLLIASGMVNGFTPRPSALDPTKTMPDKCDRIIAREANVLAFACSRCEGAAYATGFELIDASLAEKFKLSVDRISIMEGVRVAKVQPSAVLGK